jgi:G protein beta subunit-like protein
MQIETIKLMIYSEQGNVYIWRMIQDSEVTRIVPIATFQAHKDYLTRVLLSPDVKHLATCSADHTAKIWNLDPEYPPAKAAAATRLKAKPSSSINGATINGTATPVSTDSQTLPRTNTSATQGSSSDLIASDFSMVGAQSPATASGEQPQHAFPVQPDGPPMDPSSGTLFLETTLANHQRWVWDCAFSADSAYLVTVSSDHYARLWELASGQIIRQYSGHHRGAVCVALNDYSEPR